MHRNRLRSAITALALLVVSAGPAAAEVRKGNAGSDLSAPGKAVATPAPAKSAEPSPAAVSVPGKQGAGGTPAPMGGTGTAAPSRQAVSDANDAMVLAQFLTYDNIPREAEQQAKAAITALHAGNIARDAHMFDELRGVAQKIRRAPQDAVLRNNLWLQIAKNVAADPALGQDGLVGLILRYNPIIINEGNGASVLRTDLEFLVAARLMVRTFIESGRPDVVPAQDLYEAEARQIAQRLPELWPQLSQEQRRKLEDGEHRYIVLRTAMRNPSMRQALQATAQRMGGSDIDRIAVALQDQSVQLTQQRRAAGGRGTSAMIAGYGRANAQIFRYGLLANQFTALSARAFH